MATIHSRTPCREIRGVVRSDVVGRSAEDEQVGQDVDDVGQPYPPPDPDGDAFARELVNHVEHPELAAVMDAVLDEVIGPDVVRPLGPKPHARAVVEPEPPSPSLFLRDLRPLPSPDPLDPLQIHDPARMAQQSRDPPVAAVAILASQRHDIGGQRRQVVPPGRTLPLCRLVLAQTQGARRSVTPSLRITRSTHRRRRAGLTSFPERPSQGSSCLASGPTPPVEAGRSRPRVPSGASPSRPSTRRIRCASDRT